MTSGRASEEKEAPLASFGDFSEELVLMLEPSPLALFLLDFLLNNPIMNDGGVQLRLPGLTDCRNGSRMKGQKISEMTAS